MTRLFRVGLVITALAAGSAACGGGSTESAVPATPAPTVSPVDPATAGNVTGRIAFEGAPPKPNVVRMDSDPNCVQPGVTTTDELVLVGDAPMDADLVSFVGALREACVNAAKHSGVAEMSVFVESTADVIDAFVRDRGRGFDRGDTTPDRRGIAQSIEGRLGRMGGIAVVDSVVGQGTEVRLSLPRRLSAAAGQGSAQ